MKTQQSITGVISSHHKTLWRMQTLDALFGPGLVKPSNSIFGDFELTHFWGTHSIGANEKLSQAFVSKIYFSIFTVFKLFRF